MTQDFGGKPWSLIHHACVTSAIERIRPTQAFFYYEFEPNGAWWDLTRKLVTLVPIEAPRAIFGNPVAHPAHRSDVVRLEKLLEMGGIYLDCDVFVHRSFDPLLGHSTVLGEEGVDGAVGLCNAVILAEPQAPFLERWHETYRGFRSTGPDEFWNEHSVEIPSRLAKEHPEELTVLPNTAFFWPAWQPAEIDQIFHSVERIVTPETYANHVWESKAWDRYLDGLTPGRVRRIDSNFHAWARPIVASLPDNYGATAMARMKRSLRRGRRRVVAAEQGVGRYARWARKKIGAPSP